MSTKINIVNLKGVVDTAVSTNVNVQDVNDKVLTFTEGTIPNAVSSVNNAKDEALSSIEDTTIHKISTINEKYTTVKSDLEDITDVAITDVNNAKSTAVNAANSAEHSLHLVNEQVTTANAVKDIVLSAESTILDKSADVTAYHEQVHDWRKDVLDVEDTVNRLLYKAMTYADLPQEGKAGTTYVVLEDETQIPAGETHGYRWDSRYKEYVYYVNGSEEGANTFTNKDRYKIDKDHELTTTADTLPRAINEVKKEFEDKFSNITANQDISDGIITNPTLISEDSDILIPENRQVVLSELDIEGTVTVDGDLTIIKDPSKPVTKVTLMSPDKTVWVLGVDNEGNITTKKV